MPYNGFARPLAKGDCAFMGTGTPDPESPREESVIEAPEADAAARPSSNPAPLTIAPTGKRQAFRDIRRQLQETELASPGVQRLLLEDLERAEGQCDILQGYVDRYHEADKRAAVLLEKVRTQTAIEIYFGVGLGVGCAIIGLAPSFWDTTSKGPITLTVGILLVIGATLGRLIKR